MQSKFHMTRYMQARESNFLTSSKYINRYTLRMLIEKNSRTFLIDSNYEMLSWINKWLIES